MAISDWAQNVGVGQVTGGGSPAGIATAAVKSFMPFIQMLIGVIVAIVMSYMLFKVVCDLGGWGWHR